MEGALRFSLDRSLRRATMLTALLLLAHCAQRAESIVPRPSCLNRQEGLRAATENVKYLEQQLASVQRALVLAERERGSSRRSARGQRVGLRTRPKPLALAVTCSGHYVTPFPTC